MGGGSERKKEMEGMGIERQTEGYKKDKYIEGGGTKTDRLRLGYGGE